jgi:hypothetical protein
MKYSSFQVLNGYDDFDKIGFTLTTSTTGKKVSVYADRCGGNVAEAIVKNSKGKQVFKSQSPDDELLAIVAAKQAEMPECMPYFLCNHDDYVTLKLRACAAVLDGSSPEGVASIQDAVETLKLAEYLEPELKKMLKGKKSAAAAEEETGKKISPKKQKVKK